MAHIEWPKMLYLLDGTTKVFGSSDAVEADTAATGRAWITADALREAGGPVTVTAGDPAEPLDPNSTEGLIERIVAHGRRKLSALSRDELAAMLADLDADAPTETAPETVQEPAPEPEVEVAAPVEPVEDAAAPVEEFSPLDHDHDGEDGGAVPATPDLTALRAEYRALAKKNPGPNWDAAKIAEMIATLKAQA